MPPEILPPPLAALPGLSARALRSSSQRELLFCIANDTRALAPYRSALVFTARRGSMQLRCVSGLSTVEPQAAFTLWAQKVATALARHIGAAPADAEAEVQAAQPPPPTRTSFGPADVDEPLRATWAEYWPDTVSAFALGQPASPGALPAGLVVYLTDAPWPSPLVPLLHTLHLVHGAALQGPTARRLRPARVRAGVLASGLVVALAAALAFIPVRQFVVAPAEVVSLDAIAVTSPLDGVVAQLAVKPNQPVRQGAELFRLDDTTLRNRLRSAQEALEVARADYVASTHRTLLAGSSGPASAEAGVLRGRIAERQAEVAYLREQLQLLVIRAPRDGIAVYGQENDWIGKPVAAGQRVMDLADQSKPGVLVWLPVADAIQMTTGAPLQLVLQVDPLNPRTATLQQASYQPTRSPDGVAAYRLLATLPPDSTVRLGLRGSARLDGQEVSLGYFLLRRPISAVRQWFGL